jgi:hypothetical protein
MGASNFLYRRLPLNLAPKYPWMTIDYLGQTRTLNTTKLFPRKGLLDIIGWHWIIQEWVTWDSNPEPAD